MIRKLAPNLYVGNDAGIEEHLDKAGWSCCVAAKEPYHRDVVGYETRGCPPDDPEYLWARRKNNLFMNLIDHADVSYIPKKLIEEALKFITERLDAGDKVLVACNHGISRSPSICLLWLAKYGLLPHSFEGATRKFRKIYPEYDPANGMRDYVRRELPNLA